MHKRKKISRPLRSRYKNERQKNERGVIITLVAVFMLGVVGAMAALSIDVVSLYTARSEAQLAADAAALAGARVLANSGMTSYFDTTVGDNAVPLAMAVATQVAASSLVGGRTLNPGASPCTAGQEICVNIPTGNANFVSNPQVTVTVQRADLPTFFARIWGTKQVTVAAKAIAEAYNPSSLLGTTANPPPPIAPSCVKPWLLPNINPKTGAGNIFNPATGQISDATLLGWETPTGPPPPPPLIRLRSDCYPASCASGTTPTAWKFYPGTTDPTTGSFPAPDATSCNGCTGFDSYQLSVAGCVQPPISCTSNVNIENTLVINDTDTAQAVDALTHSSGNGGDSIDNPAASPPTGTAPFQFLAGTENPVVVSGGLTGGSNIMVSDSLVTVPVINADAGTGLPATFPQVQIIGFAQLFLSPNGNAANFNGHIRTQIINLVGCGTTGTSGQPILGNGASAVAVRLISQ